MSILDMYATLDSCYSYHKKEDLPEHRRLSELKVVTSWEDGKKFTVVSWIVQEVLTNGGKLLSRMQLSNAT